MLDATEQALQKIQAPVRRERRPLRGAAAIGEAVGAVLNRKKMAKHFSRTITDTDFTFTSNAAAIAAEQRLDGIYVLRTSVPPADLPSDQHPSPRCAVVGALAVAPLGMSSAAFAGAPEPSDGSSSPFT